jgi:methyl-accepting chemotaxis protein
MDTSIPTSPVPTRRRFIIDSPFQWKIIILVLTTSSIAIMLVLSEYYFYFGRQVSSNILDPRLFIEANRVLLVKLVVFFVALSMGVVLMSHRIAGPLYRLERVCQSVAKGDLSHRANWRRGDELQKLKTEFNLMLDSLHKNLGAYDQTVKETLSRVEELRKTEGLSAEAQQSLQTIQNELTKLTQFFTF